MVPRDAHRSGAVATRWRRRAPNPQRSGHPSRAVLFPQALGSLGRNPAMMRPALQHWALPVVVIIAATQCAPPAPHTPSLSGLTWLQAVADSGKELPRPRLPAGSDTNSAAAYYKWGTRIAVPTDTAEMALYWASRLDPEWAEPLFA